MRGVNGESRALNNTLETINAAATAIAYAENRVPHASTVQKRRWGSCWSLYSCFGSNKHNKRIGHAVLVPETLAPASNVPASENSIQAPARVLPFVAPPSSPASFLQSEPPSAAQSPSGSLSLTSIAANMYSPGGPRSIFAIGPYAHEPQLVSPPVFSTFTTEPSTAPYTPPPESVHLTTPSSPEVPFAQLLDPNYRNAEAGQRFPLSQYEFQSYQLYPGSPVGQLISPSSGFSGSGTSSPFPDPEYGAGGPQYLEFRTGGPPKLLNLDKLYTHEWGSRLRAGLLTQDAAGPKSRDSFIPDCQNSEAVSYKQPDNGYRNVESAVDHRVSFELTSEDVIRCVEKKSAVLTKAVSSSLQNPETFNSKENSYEMANGHACHVGETSESEAEKVPTDEGQRQQKHRSATLGSIKEFNFDNGEEKHPEKTNVRSDWWANEKVVGKEGGPNKDWSFFPMMQPGVS